MTVLLTGASGFIGRQCLRALVTRGYDVCPVSSRPRSSDGVEWHQADLLDFDQVSRLAASVKATHLLHMAWVATPGVYWTSLENARWLAASVHLLHRFQDNGGQRAVMAGTCAEYDCSEGVCSEGTTPLLPGTLYGSCKHAMQLTLRAFAQQARLSAAWGRIFFTFGPGEYPARLVPSVIGRLLLRRSAPCSHGTQVRDFLFVEDVANAFVALLASDVSGPVNIASGTAVTVRDLVLQIARRLDAEDLLRWGARPVSAGEPPSIVADVARLRTAVGWAPRYDLATGLDVTIDWWRTQFASGVVRPEAFT
jgi:nucleoside-diphosphate-sugar epimerase